MRNFADKFSADMFLFINPLQFHHWKLATKIFSCMQNVLVLYVLCVPYHATCICALYCQQKMPYITQNCVSPVLDVYLKELPVSVYLLLNVIETNVSIAVHRKSEKTKRVANCTSHNMLSNGIMSLWTASLIMCSDEM